MKTPQKQTKVNLTQGYAYEYAKSILISIMIKLNSVLEQPIHWFKKQQLHDQTNGLTEDSRH